MNTYMLYFVCILEELVFWENNFVFLVYVLLVWKSQHLLKVTDSKGQKIQTITRITEKKLIKSIRGLH